MLPQIAPPFLGLPGLSFCNGISKDNIPYGVQFLSRRFREDKLLEVGYDLENCFSKIKAINPKF